MRFISRIVFIVVPLLAACTHAPDATTATTALALQQNSRTVILPGTYAMASPSVAGTLPGAPQAMPPGSECAQAFDDVMSHLEWLMAQRLKQTASASPQAPGENITGL